MGQSNSVHLHDRTRFVRLSLVILEELTPLLQDILQNEISPNQICLQVSRHQSLFQKLRAEQIALIQNAQNDGYKDFDITLTYTLLRNLKCIKVQLPTQGWGTSEMPGNGETTLGDDIERIRLIRNKIYGHAASPSLSETEFKEHWSNIADICRRMQTLLGKNYVQSLQTAEVRPIDAEMENTYREKIKNLCTAEKSTRELLQKAIQERAPCVKETVKIETRIPRKRKLAETLTDTSISILNYLKNNITETTSDSEIEEIYELIEQFIRENKEERSTIASHPFFDELNQKITSYASLKERKMQIVARHLRFILRLKKEYGAELESSQGSLLLTLTFSSERSYDLYMQDFERGGIGKLILDVLLYPPYLANFDLHAEDLMIYLNDKELTTNIESRNLNIGFGESYGNQISQVLAGPCRNLFRKILRKYVPEIDFLAKIEEYKETLIPSLNDEQQRLLYPERALFSVSYENFDLSMLYILLKNICGIRAHKKGWGNFPNSTDTSLSANIDRIMDIHVIQSGDVPRGISTRTDFDKVMKKITQISGKIETIIEDSTEAVSTLDQGTKTIHEQESKETENVPSRTTLRDFWNVFKTKITGRGSEEEVVQRLPTSEKSRGIEVKGDQEEKKILKGFGTLEGLPSSEEIRLHRKYKKVKGTLEGLPSSEEIRLHRKYKKVKDVIISNKDKSPATQTSSITVPGANGVNHIAIVTSDRLWVNGRDGPLLQVDSTGHVTDDKLRVGNWITGCHTVTEDRDLLFIDDSGTVCKLTSDGTVTTLLTTDWGAYCIHSSRINGDILVGSPGTVTRYDRTGRELQVIERDNKGHSLYECPYYIMENQNGDILVSVGYKKAVVAVDKSGHHRFDYTGRQSDFDPYGICTDVLGHVLVCDAYNHSVHLLDQDGQFLSLLLTREQHGIRYPTALCVDDQHNLYLGQYGNDTINVYKYLQDTDVKKIDK